MMQLLLYLSCVDGQFVVAACTLGFVLPLALLSKHDVVLFFTFDSGDMDDALKCFVLYESLTSVI